MVKWKKKRVAGLRNVEVRRERYDSDLDVDSEKTECALKMMQTEAA